MLGKSGSFVTPIYNEAYLEKQDALRRAAEKLPGELYRKNEVRYTLDLRHGLTVVDQEAFDQLEEDLATMFGERCPQETVLGAERHKQIFREACIELMRDCGSFFTADQIQNVFPGLKLDNIGAADFSTCRIQTFVLNEENYWDFMRLREGVVGAPPSQATAMILGRSWEDAEKPKLFGLELAGGYRKLHRGSAIKHLLIINEVQTPEGPCSKEKIAYFLKRVLKHEVLHAFSPREGLLPEDTYEGVIEAFALYPGTVNEEAPSSLVTAARLVRGVMELCRVAGGLSDETMGKALLGKQPAEIHQMRATLKTRVSNLFDEYFFEKGFWNNDARVAALDRLREVLL